MGRRKDKPATAQGPRSAVTYANALGRAGSGVADIVKATVLLALLATRDAFVLGKAGVGTAVAARSRRDTAVAAIVRPAPITSAAAATNTTRNRLIIGGALVAVLAVGGFVFRWLRSQNELPEPAAAPPSVRDISTNGSAPATPTPAGGKARRR